jgi:D-serine deaminase-like pyridoxal phosphate-dependent protein
VQSTPYPHLRLDIEAMEHNVRTMAGWCAGHGVALAPHIKTTMSEPIVARQAASGAIGVTVATVDQAEVALGWGHRWIVIANEVVDPHGLERLKALLEEDSQEVRCLIDSEAGIAAAQAVLGSGGPALEVMLDVGTTGGRTGVRTASQAHRLARRIEGTSALRLVGVAGYEGVVPNTRTTQNIAAVDAHCRAVRDVYLDIAELFETDAPLFTMGGSAFPDRVVAHLPTSEDVPGTTRLLRAGCYVTHDHGTYARVTPIPELQAALTVRAVVVSAEDGTIVVGAGKRDLPYDVEAPIVLAAHDADGHPRTLAGGAVTAMYDQHTVLTGTTELAVSDVVTFGISHPCSVFDRWPEYLVTNKTGEVIDVWHTRFDRPSIAARSRTPPDGRIRYRP